MKTCDGERRENNRSFRKKPEEKKAKVFPINPLIVEFPDRISHVVTSQYLIRENVRLLGEAITWRRDHDNQR